MKLWHSFIKELKLSSKSFYFYVEVAMACLLLFILLFVVPEEFSSRVTEYVYWDIPEAAVPHFTEEYEDVDLDKMGEAAEIESDGEVYQAIHFETEKQDLYVVESREAAIQLADKEKNLGAVITMDAQGKVTYEYFLQGYESERLKNIYLLFHNETVEVLEAKNDSHEVQFMSSGETILSDRENMIPSVLTFNGALMGLFVIAAYIFLDKKEGILKAYAVTASSVWHYLMSKVGVIIVTSIISSVIVVIPIMGLQPNYPLLLLFLLATGFFASALGLLIASFYDNIMQAFSSIYLVMIAMIIPNIAYFIPSWEPTWVKMIPSYSILAGFKEIILGNGDTNYVLMASLGYFVAGLILFMVSNVRYKKTLTV